MDRTAPNCQLKLEWVYGYRSHQVRSNLYYNDENEVIYFVAGVGIVHNHTKQTQRFFLGHDDDIISLTMHPDKVQVATGQVGKSPQIIVWNSKTLETTSIMKGGHTDGIGILAFNKTGDRLTSCGIDQDSTIIVWDWAKGKILAKSTGHQERVFDLQFNPYKENALVSCGIKQISFWNLIGNTLQKKKGIFGQVKDIQTMFCMAFSKEKEIYYTGTMNGQVYVWEGNQLKEIIPGVHNGSIFTMVAVEDGFITGGKDGKIRTWDASFSPIDTIDLVLLVSEFAAPFNFIYNDEVIIRSLNRKDTNIIIGLQSSDIIQLNMTDLSKIEFVCKGHAEGELWSLAVSPVNSEIFATASDDHTVRVWNMKTKKLIKVVELEKRIRSCAFSQDGLNLACGLSDGRLVVVKIEDMSIVFQQKCRNEVLHEMKYSPCGEYLAVGSNENFVDVFKTKPTYKRLGSCSGNSSFITHLDWSKDSKFIQTNSGDGARLIYQIPGCKQFTVSDEIKKIQWSTFTGVLGEEVVGIWEKYTNKTDVNATDAYFDQKCIVTGDDFGLVKLFRFPSLKKGAKFRKYVGHSSHVTNVRFSKDHTRIFSTGGADHAIFQWRFFAEDSAGATNTARSENESENAKADELTPDYNAYMDSNSEDSDSDASGKEVDSDIENEKEISYDRKIYKEDLVALKPKIKEEIKIAESEQSFKRQNTPDVSLSLEFVFGYRGYDCRDNLFYITDTGEIVYHVAALGIVYDKESQVQRFYNQHTDDILCLSLFVDPKDNKKILAATGQIGRDPPIHVWDIKSMKTISILKGEHFRGVCSLNFSPDGKKLASVGLDDNHSICVWEWKKGEKLATTRGHKDKIFCIKWNPHANDKLVTAGVKHLKFWNQVGGGFTSNRGIFGKNSDVENMMCITFGKTPNVCYTGGGNGSIFMWVDQKLTKVIPAHNGPIFAIYAQEQWEAYVTGGKDGCIILWNGQFNQIHKYNLDKKSLSKTSKGILLSDLPSVRAISLASKKILIGTKNGEIIDIDKNGVMSIVTQGHGEGELWGLSCHPNRKEICTASDDKTLRIWSIESKQRSLIRGKVFDKLCRACQYSPNGDLIAVGFKEGTVCVIKSDTLEEVATVNHRTQEISDLKFSPFTGKYLAVGSHENFIDIYNVESKKRVGICKGSSSYITHVEWDNDGKLLMTNSGAKELLYFEAPKGARINVNADAAAKINWSTFTSVLGSTCEGIWQPCMDITDINTTCLSKNGRTLATGDDFGLVKLFEYPCIGKFAKFKKYNGHSSHVTSVRWTFDDMKLISVGGNDTSIMIWNNLSFSLDGPIGTIDPTGDSVKQVRSTASIGHSELVQLNSRKGESEDSETDSEDEGYDSDVKREHDIDYNKSINMNEIKRPSAEAVKNMYNKVTNADKGELARPSRMVKTKFKRTKVNKVKSGDGKEVDPLTLIHVMAKLGAATDDHHVVGEDHGDLEIKQQINGLNLKFIHGYRGFDCRDNLFYINDGTSIVYHAAAAGIVFNLVENTQKFYLQHDDDIISLCINDKYKNTVATGQIGQKAQIHIWDVNTMETLSILSGLHTQGVCSVGFSRSGKLLVSVGLDKNHTIGIWRWKEGSLAASAVGDSRRIFRVMFRPDSDTVFVSVGFKHVKFWNIAGSELIKKNGVLTDSEMTSVKLKKMPTMLSIAFGLDNLTYTGSQNGDVFIWKDNVLIRTIAKAHNGPIFTMYTSLFDGYIVTGAKEKVSKNSGSVKVWDANMSKTVKMYNLDENETNVVKSVCRIKMKSETKIIVGTKYNNIFEIQEKSSTIQSHMIGHSEGELWGLATHPTREIYVTASYDGFLRIWDIKTKRLLSKNDCKAEIRCVDFSPDGLMLAVGCKSGEIILYKTTKKYDKFEKLDSNRQRKTCITDIKFSPRKSYLAAGSNDNAIDFYEVSSNEHGAKLTRISYCTQMPGSVLQMDWEISGEYLKVGTSNYKTVIYEVPKGNQINDDTINDRVEWSQWTSIFGAEVIGIWPGDVGKNFINCCHLASVPSKLATGDDDGAVKLYKFPCLEKNDNIVPYYGHSSNITNLKFLYNNTHLISIGGEDFCIFVWECT